ncbi:glycosyltransferase family 2 protein, partial [Cellulosimicrobium cellulans]|uniref:glycosyltransferase family 2 protein n=1 Tax=Cellulosimicrobium cellulans TaxID=1710 RepID=UPI0036F0C3AA
NRASVSWTTDPIVTKPFFPWLPGTGAGTMGIRRAVFEEAGGFDESLVTGEDVDLSWRVQLAGHRLVHHPEIVLHVRKRDGLRAVFRQAYAYGAGDRLLQHRYADVAAAFTTGAVTSGPGPADPGPPVARAGALSVVRRVARTVRNKLSRGRAGLAETVWRVGEQAGHRWGRVDPAASRVPVPAVLPPPV